jgi:hypothetical protein
MIANARGLGNLPDGAHHRAMVYNLPPHLDRGFSKAEGDARRERMIAQRQPGALSARVASAAGWVRRRLRRHR